MEPLWCLVRLKSTVGWYVVCSSLQKIWKQDKNTYHWKRWTKLEQTIRLIQNECEHISIKTIENEIMSSFLANIFYTEWAINWKWVFRCETRRWQNSSFSLQKFEWKSITGSKLKEWIERDRKKIKTAKMKCVWNLNGLQTDLKESSILKCACVWLGIWKKIDKKLDFPWQIGLSSIMLTNRTRMNCKFQMIVFISFSLSFLWVRFESVDAKWTKENML